MSIKTISFVGFSVLIVSSIFVWLTKPYMSYQSVRIGDTPTTIEVEYLSMTGDALCTKLYEINNHQGIFPNVPDDLPDPHSIPSLKEGDRITLVGYPYEWQAKNLITQSVKKKPIGMVDVVAWNKGAEIRFASNSKNLSPDKFKRENYSDCR